MDNIPYTPQNLFAKYKGEIYSIKEIPKDIKEGLTCPCCNKTLRIMALNSEYKQTYFAHLQNESCIKYEKSSSNKRINPIHKREMELTETQAKNLKERLEGLEYIYEFIKRNRNGVTNQSKKELLKAVSLLDYEDQIFVWRYARKVTCLKPIIPDLTKRVNKNAIDLLQAKYPKCKIKNSTDYKVAFSYYKSYWRTVYSDEERIIPHQVSVKYKDYSFETSPRQKDNGHLYLTEGDFERISNEIQKWIEIYDKIDEMFEVMVPICKEITQKINNCKNNLWSAKMKKDYNEIEIRIVNKRTTSFSIYIKEIRTKEDIQEEISKEMNKALTYFSMRIMF